MPLRDHFRPPVSLQAAWDALHGMWPADIVRQLRVRLPPGYVAAPVVHSGSHDNDEFAVRVYDAERGRQLVATIELISPGNKDRPEKRNAFVAKCVALLQRGVAVSLVDVITLRHFNLYAELLRFLGQSDPSLGEPPPPLYAVSCRCRPRGERMLLQAWSHGLAVGQPLPTLPVWLAETLAVPLDLDGSYEQVCHDLWIS